MTDVRVMRDLNVSEGDIVRCVKVGPSWRGSYTVGREYIIDGKDDIGGVVSPNERTTGLFTVVRRASDQPRTWNELTDEEKGALLLAAHEGKTVEWSSRLPLYAKDKGNFTEWRCVAPDAVGKFKSYAYRVRPEPVRETETVAVSLPAGDYVITFETVNGEPDYESVGMARMKRT